jgi:hypothetical protein
MDYNYSQYYRTFNSIIHIINYYSLNNANFTNNRINESKVNGINIIYYIHANYC